MSEPIDTGSRDRATVALAVEKIDGLKALTALGFEEVHRRLDAVEGLPERVTRLEARETIYSTLPNEVGGVIRVAADHEHRLEDLERDRDSGRASWTVHWPTLILSLLAIAVALFAALPH